MLELRLSHGSLLKKAIDSIKDLVSDANFDCSSTGLSLQAMDSSHVALVSLLLRSEGFEHFRCDRNIFMGINVAYMAKVLRCANPDDVITLKADDGSDTVTFMFESPTQDKISDYEMKLIDIDSDHLWIPEAQYNANVKMPAVEFANICHCLAGIGDTVTISVSKQGVTFSVKGDIGTGNITCRHNSRVDKPEEATVIEMQEPVSLTFALKYVNTFTKATTLSSQVTIGIKSDMPAMFEYKIAEMGFVRFYLAPKVEDEELENTHQTETSSLQEPNSNLELDAVEKQEDSEVEMETDVLKVKIGTEDESQVKMEDETDGNKNIDTDVKFEAGNGEAKMEDDQD